MVGRADRRPGGQRDDFLLGVTGGDFIEADGLEAMTSGSRAVQWWRAPVAVWILMLAAGSLTVVSIARHMTDPSASWPAAGLLVSVPAAVGVIAAGAVAARSSSRIWDAAFTTGLGCLVVGVAVVLRLPAIAEEDGRWEGLNVAASLAFLSGLSLVLCALAGSSPVRNSSVRRARVVGLVVGGPAVAAFLAARSDGDLNGGLGVGLLVVGMFAMTLAGRLLRCCRETSLIDSGVAVAFGVGAAAIAGGSTSAASAPPVAAATAWTLLLSIFVLLESVASAARAEQMRQRRLLDRLAVIAEARSLHDEVRDERHRVGHNGSSSLVAIEGALASWRRAIASGESERATVAVDAALEEIGRLRRMLAFDHSTDVAAQVSPLAARISAREVAVVDVAAVLGPVLTLARERGQRVRCDIPSRLEVIVPGDPIAEIVHNLLDNAARHARGAEIRLSARDRGAWVELLVVDDGPGVDADVAERLFSPGVVSSRTGGTGIGLSSSLQLARLIGATLELVPTQQGAAFRLSIPTPAATEPTEPAEDESGPGCDSQLVDRREWSDPGSRANWRPARRGRLFDRVAAGTPS